MEMTIERAQAALKDLSEVCQRHGIALIGECFGEGTKGEIVFVDAADPCVAEFNVNTINYYGHGDAFYTTAIG